MKKFNKYIIPSIVLLGLLVLVFTTIRTLSVLSDITTSDVLISKAIDTAITFNILKFLVCLGLVLYTTNFLGYLYRSDEKKKDNNKQQEEFREVMLSILKKRVQKDKESELKKDVTRPVTTTFPEVRVRNKSEFRTNEAYYKYLQEEFTAYLKLVDWSSFHNSTEWNEWLNIFNKYKPLMKDYDNSDEYHADYRTWYKHLPIIVCEGLVERGMVTNDERIKAAYA